MQTVSLETAVSHILQAVGETHGGEDSPFFFLTCAGVSHPSIPLASEIVEHCRTIAELGERTDAPSDDSSMSAYSHWLQQAFPQPHQRQEYFRQLIENKPLSPAGLRLGHLLLEQSVTNLLVTPNFDDFISRSLAMFGGTHRLCDHPATTDRIDAEEADTQIVHVHGTFWFYDCCNLTEEIADRAEADVNSTVSMSALLNRLFARRSPLVVGYSGWEGDVIMAALQRRLQTGLRSNLYWFLYKQTDIGTLPGWLREHRNVFFVLPETASRDSPDEGEMAEEVAADGVDNPQQVVRAQPVKPVEESTLSAQRVFDEFIQELGLSAPSLAVDPLGFFAQNLSQQLSYEDGGGSADLYSLANVVSRIERAREWDAEQLTKQEDQETSLEAIRDALRRSQYTDLLAEASELDTDGLGVEQLTELAGAVYLAASASDEATAEQWAMAVDLLGRLTAAQPEDESLRLRLLITLRGKAEVLEKTGQLDEAHIVWDEVLTRFANDEQLSEQVAWVLSKKADALDDAGRPDEAMAVLDRLIELFREKPQAAVPVAWALGERAHVLGERGDRDAAEAMFEELEHGFVNVPGASEAVAWALLWKGDLLRGAGDIEDAALIYQRILQHDDATDLGESLIAWAMLGRGDCLADLRQEDDAKAQYEQLFENFESIGKVDYQKALALQRKARILVRNDERDAAITVYERLTRFFLDSDNENARNVANEAESQKAALLEPEAEKQ